SFPAQTKARPVGRAFFLVRIASQLAALIALMSRCETGSTRTSQVAFPLLHFVTRRVARSARRTLLRAFQLHLVARRLLNCVGLRKRSGRDDKGCGRDDDLEHVDLLGT